MSLRIIPAAMIILCVAALVWAETDEDDITVAQQVALAELAAKSTAQVEVTVRYDEGDAPRAGDSSSYYSYQNSGDGLSGYVREERPVLRHGYAISDTEVIVVDLVIHPRFIESIKVVDGEKKIPAEIASYIIGANHVILKLSEPFTTVKPLNFDSSLEEPYLVMDPSWRNGEWIYRIKQTSQRPVLTASGKEYLRANTGLVVNYEGKPVGYTPGDVRPTDDSWKGSPLDWPAISAEQMTAMIEKTSAIVTKGVLRVRLGFRSPKKTTNRYRSDEETETEINALALLVDEQTLLVMVGMNPKQTARLDRIEVFIPDGDSVEAEFAFTLKDYGAFVAKLEAPLDGALKSAAGPISQHMDKVLISAQLTLVGQEYTQHYLHGRLSRLYRGWKSRLYPTAEVLDGDCMLFCEDGSLVAFPMTRRYPGGSKRNKWDRKGTSLTPVGHLWELMDDIPSHADASNVPLGEADESRLAWLGVELQELNEELARANNVSDQTNDGSTGAMISYIYSGSPAAEAGVQVGDIFLRLHVADVPKPIAIEIDNENIFPGGVFPWDRLDEIPEQYFDMIPKPWPDAENKFSRMLTDIGFGKNLRAEFSRDGEILTKEFSITQGPSHFNSAPKFKSKPLGLTVRDMTYEVRRYFQKVPEDPGVIISKIEPGSKASVAGLKPYEIITHVNDEPVKSAEQFGKLVDTVPELRLQIKRMNLGRVVKVKQVVETKPETNTTPEPAPEAEADAATSTAQQATAVKSD